MAAMSTSAASARSSSDDDSFFDNTMTDPPVLLDKDGGQKFREVGSRNILIKRIHINVALGEVLACSYEKIHFSSC
jgi:hypothetical protein